MNLDLSNKKEGYKAVRLIAAFEELDPEARVNLLKEKKFKKWVHDVSQLQLDHSPRIIAIMRHDKFRKLVFRYCSTRYGEDSFAWSVMYGIICSKLDCIWIPEIEKFLEFSDAIFGDLQNIPSYDDWTKISELSPDRPDSKLRLLFFPTIEDYFHPGKSGKKAIRKQQPWSLGYESAPQSLPTSLNTHVVIDNIRYTYRRPNFLVPLSDEQYLDVFWKLQNFKRIQFPTWKSWIDLKDKVSRKVKNIMHHIVVWVDPSWQYPAVATHSYKDLLWEKEITNVIFKKSTLAEGRSRPWGNNNELTDDELREKAVELIRRVWRDVCEDEWWQDKNIAKRTLIEPPAAMSEDDWQGNDDVVSYLSRFQHASWMHIAQCVVELAGPCFSGAMDKFNDSPTDNHNTPQYVPWGTICVEENFRLNDLLRQTPVVDNPESRIRLRDGLDILLTKWHYGELKKSMCDTLEHGFHPIPDIDFDGHKIHTIASKEAYEKVKRILYDHATFLHDHSVYVDIDNFSEDLAQFKLIPPSPPSEPKPAKMGFLNAEPADDNSSVESSERSNDATEGQSPVSPTLSIQDLIESDTQPDGDSRPDTPEESQGVRLVSRSRQPKRRRIR